jgi:hypothetical protein
MMFAIRAFLIDGHFGFAFRLFEDIVLDVFPNPIPLFLDGHVAFYGSAHELLET